MGALPQVSASKRKREEEKEVQLGAIAPKMMKFSSKRVGLSEFVDPPREVQRYFVNRTHCWPSIARNSKQTPENQKSEAGLTPEIDG